MRYQLKWALKVKCTMPKLMIGSLRTLPYGTQQGSIAGRVYKKGPWNGLGARAKALHQTDRERWYAMEESCWQCKDKWELLTSDFRKVWDYEKKFPSGRSSIFELSPSEKRAFKLNSRSHITLEL
ncbi:hypothetical protein O6H91_16G034800 [Diphasiastrum complanatum]|uniref:Uncharacterized protein n=1 Tax=Diphasiastrum complanatum TaxID=34168 RepID=A0ACC2BBC0_DIPCM|nr:hypothetical protein O6H91_16G034800 [Diphasiastrum complanatum]